MRDLYSSIDAAVALAPAVLTASVSGPAIDLRGANRAAVLVTTGAIAGAGVFGVKLQESDTPSSGDFADVPADLVDSDAPAILAADSAYRLGYRGHKRFLRLAATRAGGTSIALGAVAVRSDLAQRPAP
jgi:hypothetical protein